MIIILFLSLIFFLQVEAQCGPTASGLLSRQDLCEGASASPCSICGPPSVDVPRGSTITFHVTLSGCTLGTWSSNTRFQTPIPSGISLDSEYSSDTDILWTISAASSATIGTSRTVTSQWCNEGRFAGLETTYRVVASGTTTTPAPTTTPTTPAPTTTPPTTTPAPTTTPTTPAPGQSCPSGYTMVANSGTSVTWCDGVSSCQTCIRKGNWNGNTAVVDIALACPLTRTVSSWRSWYNPYDCSNDRVWWARNAGTTFTLHKGPNAGDDSFELGMQWCIDYGTYRGYVAVETTVPLP